MTTTRSDPEPVAGAPEERVPWDLAVDRHRRSLVVVCMDRDGQERWRRRFPATSEGEADLHRRLQPGDRVVMEATSGVHRLANFLESSGAQVIVADAHQARLLGMRGKKTDWRDCLALLRHLRAGEIAAVWRPDAATRAVRQLTRERHAYNQGIGRLKNRIRALLYEEGLEYGGNLWTEAGQAWITHVSLRPAARRILERERLALASLVPLKALQEEELAERAVAWPEAQRLMQILGFGAAGAVMWLGEVGEVSRFASAKQLVSYAGLDPRVHQSDTTHRTGSVSKAGRSQLRWLMVEIAWSHVLHQGPEAELYHRLVRRGKLPGVAIVALARHLLVVAHRLLTHQENYRQLNAATYERKLIALGARRPWSEDPQETNRDWGASRYEAVTGQRAPRTLSSAAARGTRRRAKPTRRSRPDPGAGCEPAARGGGSEFTARGESDSSEPPPLAGRTG